MIDIVDYNAAPHGEREISDQALSGVIETLSDSKPLSEKMALIPMEDGAMLRTATSSAEAAMMSGDFP